MYKFGLVFCYIIIILAVKIDTSERADKVVRGFYNCATCSVFAFQTFLPGPQQIVVNFFLTPLTETKVMSLLKKKKKRLFFLAKYLD